MPHSGYRFAAEYDVERKFHETRLYQIALISTNLVLLCIGRAGTGDAAVVLKRQPNANCEAVASFRERLCMKHSSRFPALDGQPERRAAQYAGGVPAGARGGGYGVTRESN
jgi:hypothetical protein